MIFVSADWENDTPQVGCVKVSFDGGKTGGGAEFTYCNGERGSILVGPGQQSIVLCLQNGSWITPLNVILYGPCTAKVK